MNRKIAIPVNENKMLESHFGQTQAFAIYEIENNTIVDKKLLTPPPHAPGVLPKWVNQQGVTELLANTIGERAKKILDYYNVVIKLGTPVMEMDELIEKYLAGKLEFNPKLCDHHQHQHDYEHNQNH